MSRGRIDRSERAPATPETEAKLQQDAILQLVASGRITTDQAAAIEDIRDLWATMTQGMTAGVDRYTDGFTAGGRPQVRGPRLSGDPLSRMSRQEDKLYRAVWKPWADDLGRTLGQVLDAVVDNRAHEVRPDVLADALDRWNRLKQCEARAREARGRGHRSAAGPAAAKERAA